MLGDYKKQTTRPLATEECFGLRHIWKGIITLSGKRKTEFNTTRTEVTQRLVGNKGGVPFMVNHLHRSSILSSRNKSRNDNFTLSWVVPLGLSR